MAIEVTARHMDIGVDTQEYAREKAEKLMQEFPGVEFIHVILDNQKHIYSAELVVQGKNHTRIEAEDSSDDVIASLDTAVDRAERQLRKQKDKIQEHRP